jgi:hypothetical protein
VTKSTGNPQPRLGDASTRLLEVTDGERGLRQPDVVVQHLERVGRGACLDDGGLDLGLGGRAVDTVDKELNRSAERVALRVRRASLLLSLRKQGLCLLGPARIREGGPEVREEVQATRGSLGQERRRSAEEVAGRDEVDCGECPRSSVSE